MGIIISKICANDLNCCTVNKCKNYIDKSINKMIFYPPNTPKKWFYELNNERSKLFFLNSSSGNLINCIYILPNIKSDKYLVFCQGNASDIYASYDFLIYLSNELNINIICFDYSGYGLSSGKPSEKNCYKDISSLIYYLNFFLFIPNERIILMGHSLGTGIIVDYAYKNDWISPIILISAYKTIIKVVYDNNLCKIIDKFKTEDKIGYLNCPIKFFHGEKDDVVDISHGKYLYKKIKNKKINPSWINEANHVDILNLMDLTEIKIIIS